MASTDIGPKFSGFDMSSYPHQPTRSAYVLVLKKTDPSPLAPESDEEKTGDEKKGDSPSDKPAESEEKTDPAAATATPSPSATPSPKPDAKKPPPRVTIDFDRASQRILSLPIPARNFIALAAAKANTIFLFEQLPPSPGVIGLTVHKFDMEKRKLDKVLDSVRSFDLSANGEKMLFRQGDNWFIASTTQPFCRTCDRARLTADGVLLLCLYAQHGTDLRRPLRAGASRETLLNLLNAVWRGRADRGAEERRSVRDRGTYIPLSVLKRDAHLEMHTRGG
jgi:hypothetical protein